MLKKFDDFMNKQSEEFCNFFVVMLAVLVVMAFTSLAVFFTKAMVIFVIVFPLLFVLGTFIVAQFKETNE